MLGYVIRKSLQYYTNPEKQIEDLKECQPITETVVSDLPVLWQFEDF